MKAPSKTNSYFDEKGTLHSFIAYRTKEQTDRLVELGLLYQRVLDLPPGHEIVRHQNGKWSAGPLMHMSPGYKTLHGALSKAKL